MTKPMDVVVLLVSWYVFGLWFHTSKSAHGLFPIWVLLASLLSMITLGTIGYYDHQIPVPDISGVVTLLFALPLAALTAKWLLMLTSHIPPIRYSETLKASGGVALVFEILHVVMFKIHCRWGRKWTLVTHLEPEELQALNSQVNKSGASWIDVRRDEAVYKNGGLHGYETMVISRRAVRHLKDHPELLAAHLRGQPVVDVTQLLKEFRGRVNLGYADGWSFLLGSTYQGFAIRFYFYLKAVAEILIALVLLVALTPLWVILSASILITSGWPILYRQERLGYRGERFYLYKFRTMPTTAEAAGPQWAKENDPRVTPLGRWLRRTRFDELPQLINVLRGELSFVGPRPERPEFYGILTKHIPLFSTRLLVRPGITGWAQVRQGYAASVEECKTKLEYDLYYVQHMSPRLDASVMVQTAALMLRGNGGR
jgi:lipopolysaccharide/colanic/teichoic acid biosynthesis glycosyltransferase